MGITFHHVHHLVRITPAATNFWILVLFDGNQYMKKVEVLIEVGLPDAGVSHVLRQSGWVSLRLLKDTLHDRVL
jgi:hypothetical protein